MDGVWRRWDGIKIGRDGDERRLDGREGDELKLKEMG
jgi:hypothetical protein